MLVLLRRLREHQPEGSQQTDQARGKRDHNVCTTDGAGHIRQTFGSIFCAKNERVTKGTKNGGGDKADEVSHGSAVEVFTRLRLGCVDSILFCTH
jgi:hypothetical protein